METQLLSVERTGGLAGFGGPGSHLRSRGQIRYDQLSLADRQTVDALFSARGKPASDLPAVADGFAYKISRTIGKRTETIAVPEARVPAALMACVKDELN